jgi:hypothetical protein
VREVVVDLALDLFGDVLRERKVRLAEVAADDAVPLGFGFTNVRTKTESGFGAELRDALRVEVDGETLPACRRRIDARNCGRAPLS